MEFHPGRKLGIVLGLVILVTIFLLPFGSSDTLTLYATASPLLSDLGDIQSGGDAAYIAFAYVTVIAFILLVIAGLVGIFPLGTGVLGVAGMAMLTIGPYLIYPNSSYGLDVGVGFVVIWVASIASLGASFWHRRRSAKMVAQAGPMPTQP